MDYLHGAVIDNWTLELTARLLSGNIHNDLAPENLEKIEALLSFLDILILNENVVFESGYSFVWDQQKSLRPIQPYMYGVTAIQNENGSLDITEADPSKGLAKYYLHNQHRKGQNADVVSHGANYYLNLAKNLGLQYWPAPKRQRYIESLSSTNNDSFLVKLDTDIRQSISNIAANISPQFLELKPARLPGFGARILADCDDSKSIIKTAIQMRDDPYTKMFREWGREMDYSLETGNVVAFQKSIKDVSLLLNDLINRFSVEKDNSFSGVKLQLGLRPSITVDGDAIGELLSKFMPKKMHIVFLRNHIEKVLCNANLTYQTKRLFGIQYNSD